MRILIVSSLTMAMIASTLGVDTWANTGTSDLTTGDTHSEFVSRRSYRNQPQQRNSGTGRREILSRQASNVAIY